MTRPSTGGVALRAAAALALIAPIHAGRPEDAATTFLEAAFGITSAEVARLDRGQVLARTLSASDGREVATLGAVRIAMSPAQYVERLADIATFKRDEAVLQIGAFGDPPRTRDVAPLTLDAFDVELLRGCRVGHCGVQLPAAAIQRFRREIDWQGPDTSRLATQLMREVLVDYVSAYRARGTTAAMQYDDRPAALQLQRELAALARSSVVGWPRFPALMRHVLEYPSTQGSTRDIVYWSKEKVARRGVITVTHLAIADTSHDSAADYAIASKQIYGSHYYDASLGLTVLVRNRAASAHATYVVYVNRSRVDVFGGLFGGVARKVVTGRARSTVFDQLTRLRQRLEATDAAAPAGAGR